MSARCAVGKLVEITVDSTVVKKWLGPKPVAAHHMFRCLVRAQHGMTALMVASVADNGKVVQEFLEADADQGMRNKAGSTASDMANMGHLRSLVRPQKQKRGERSQGSECRSQLVSSLASATAQCSRHGDAGTLLPRRPQCLDGSSILGTYRRGA